MNIHISKNKLTNEKYITKSIRMSLINDIPSYKLLVMVYNLLLITLSRIKILFYFYLYANV